MIPDQTPTPTPSAETTIKAKVVTAAGEPSRAPAVRSDDGALLENDDLHRRLDHRSEQHSEASEQPEAQSAAWQKF